MFYPTAWHKHLFMFPFSLLSSLFPDVVNCMQTDNLELKKLVYLYLMNYAKSQPDMAIMAVNSFVKVTLSQGFKSSVFSEMSLDIVSVCIANKQPLFQKRASREVLAMSRNVRVLSILCASVCHPVQTIW